MKTLSDAYIANEAEAAKLKQKALEEAEERKRKIMAENSGRRQTRKEEKDAE